MSKNPGSASPLGAPSPSSAKSAKPGLGVPSDSAMQVNEASVPYLAQASAQDVPPGYKRTEVGVIPEDWAVKPVSDLASVKTGPFGSSLHERDYVEEGTPIVTVEHLGGLNSTNNRNAPSCGALPL